MLRRSPITRKTPLRSKRRHEPEAPKSEHPTALKPSTVRGVYAGQTGRAVPKTEKPVRDEAHRRWVASLPCFECRIQGHSQAAHPNSGKAKGQKLSDAGCFPLCCDRPGVKGCHSRFDQYEIVSRAAMPEYERQALEWTQQQRSLA